MDVGSILSLDSDLDIGKLSRMSTEQLLSLLISQDDEDGSCKVNGYYTFEPRPDQPERGDQQTAFLECKSRGVIWLLGGNGAGTTELAMAKISRFVYETPPPRKDTPFWLIAESYEQVMETCWKEKLYGHGHILDCDIDWDRVTWHSVKDGLPKRVPLKSPPGSPGRNWVLEFKSWNQGRGQMQARAIGGFCFVEQFPWGVFEEVLRGCREYNLPGSKFVEYTPVDPDMSIEIEEMITNGKCPKDGTRILDARYMPDDWEVFYANTQCAMEAGHVDKEWFDEFFGMIPEEMRDVRMRGLFANYSGLIYGRFNPSVHVVGDEIYDLIPSYWHRRAIDWGAGPNNPFACVWGAKSPSFKQWYIYDEYFSADQDATVVDHLVNVFEKHPWDPECELFGPTYCDPSDPGNMRLAIKIEKYSHGRAKNIAVTGANNSVLEGIEHVRYCLKQTIPVFDEKTKKPVMQPRLFIHRKCVNLIREIRGYRWRPRSKNHTNAPVDPRPEPLKINDHTMDGLRYLLFTDDGREGITIDAVHRKLEKNMVGRGFGDNTGRWRSAIGR